jgi:DNA-binding IclR family transcriptional regulator
MTDNTIVTREDFERELTTIRERGVAFDREEQRIGVKGIAVPLMTEELHAALYVVGKAERMTGKRFEEQLPGLIMSAKNTIKQQW